jgi:hypothetical protein
MEKTDGLQRIDSFRQYRIIFCLRRAYAVQ